MRRLIYVPIIHAGPDLGSLASALGRESVALLGERRWAHHQEVVARFWQRVGEYLLALDARGLVIYQDGLAAEGELGERVVREGARRGSENYKIILSLTKKGAELRKTEDEELLKQEFEALAQAARSQSSSAPGMQYEGRKRRLLEARDRFIAKRINETLPEGASGVLFLGAYHNVLRLLAQDIAVKPLKEPEKVRAYFEGLLHGTGEEERRRLADYLACAIE